MVVDMPGGAAAGFADDMWLRTLIDMGQTGPDKGKGGKYIISGPGQKVDVPEGAFQSESLGTFWHR